jgi:hypothetical protein
MRKITTQDVEARKFAGTWLLSAIVVRDIYAYREHAQYYGYTKREAIRLFLERCNNN